METVKAKIVYGEMLLILILAFSITSVSPAAEDIWIKKADMPTARMLLSACTVDGKIYAIGGAPAPHVGISDVEEYDPVTDTWTRKAAMPTPRAGLGVSAVNGKIYAIGGGSRRVEEYDPGTDTWTRKADMPTARGFLSTSTVNGKIYAIGGAMDTGGPAFRTVEEYDPATDTWVRKADLPEPRYFHTAGVVDGKIFIIAGSWQAWTASSAVFAYDPATDTWERKTDAPTARSWQSPTAGVVDGRIYVIGGDAGPPDAEVEEYDPATDTWTTRADMPTPRGALSITALNDRIYVIGGTVTLFNDVLSTVEEYIPNLLIVDFNGDEIVNFKDFSMLAQYWYQDQSPFLDHTVDYEYVAVLAEYWLADFRLIAHWKLDETEGGIAHDCVGDKDGTLHGGPLWQPGDGYVDGALGLDGIDDYINTDFTLNPAEGSFSVFTWVKGGATGQSIVSQVDVRVGRTTLLGSTWLGTDPSEGKLITTLMEFPYGPLKSEVVITDGQWHHVGLVYDLGGLCRCLYVDGLEVARDADPVGGVSSTGHLYVGAGQALEAGSFFSGLIDDVRIYNRALSPEEIEELTP